MQEKNNRKLNPDSYCKARRTYAYKKRIKISTESLERTISEIDKGNNVASNLKYMKELIEIITANSKNLSQIRQSNNLKDCCYNYIYEEVIHNEYNGTFFNPNELPKELQDFTKDIYNKRNKIDNYSDSDEEVKCHLM